MDHFYSVEWISTCTNYTVANIFQPTVKGARTAIDNVYAVWNYDGEHFQPFLWNLNGAGGAILQPSPAPTNYPMSAPTSTADPGQVTISFQVQAAPTAAVSWNNTLTYTNTPGCTLNKDGTTTCATAVVYPVATDTPSAVGTATVSRSYTGVGGQWAMTATVGGVGKTINTTISGTTIQDCLISSRLASLYANATPSPMACRTPGATPDLLEKIAERESSYRQFALRTFYGTYARWPLESTGNALVGGKFVALMQVPNGALNAWNWITNTQSASTIFQSKYTPACNWVSQQVANDHDLPMLSPSQMEDEMLSAYGGWLSSPLNGGCGNPGGYYWQPVCPCGYVVNGYCSCVGTGNQDWQWQATTTCGSAGYICGPMGVRTQTPPVCP